MPSLPKNPQILLLTFLSPANARKSWYAPVAGGGPFLALTRGGSHAILSARLTGQGRSAGSPCHGGCRVKLPAQCADRRSLRGNPRSLANRPGTSRGADLGGQRAGKGGGTGPAAPNRLGGARRGILSAGPGSRSRGGNGRFVESYERPVDAARASLARWGRDACLPNSSPPRQTGMSVRPSSGASALCHLAGPGARLAGRCPGRGICRQALPLRPPGS